jgi:hypothetical protein
MWRERLILAALRASRWRWLVRTVKIRPRRPHCDDLVSLIAAVTIPRHALAPVLAALLPLQIYFCL